MKRIKVVNIKKYNVYYFYPVQIRLKTSLIYNMYNIIYKALGELRELTSKQETRYSRLLLRLSPIRSLQQEVLEEIFFGGLIGNVQIDTVIPILLHMKHEELGQFMEV